MSQQQFVRKETALDEFKLRLTADIQPGATKKPFLEVRFLKNNPSITVTTNVPEDAGKGFGKIRAGLDQYTFGAILAVLQGVIDNPEDSAPPSIDCVGKNWRNGGKVEVTESVFVGRKNGRVYISVQSFGRPKIPFYFGPSDYHKLTNRDGTPASDVVVSNAYATSWINIMRGMISVISVDTYVDREAVKATWDNKDQQNNGGNYNRSQQNNGGGNQSSDFDSDIPF